MGPGAHHPTSSEPKPQLAASPNQKANIQIKMQYKRPTSPGNSGCREMCSVSNPRVSVPVQAQGVAFLIYCPEGNGKSATSLFQNSGSRQSKNQIQIKGSALCQGQGAGGFGRLWVTPCPRMRSQLRGTPTTGGMPMVDSPAPTFYSCSLCKVPQIPAEGQSRAGKQREDAPI